MTRAGLFCLKTNLMHKLILFLGPWERYTRHLGSIHFKELGDSISSPSHTVEDTGSWPLRPSTALFGLLFHAQGLCQFCGQLLLTLQRSAKSLFSHPSPYYRDIGHLNSKAECSLYTPNRDQTLCFTKIHLWPRRVENWASGLNVTCKQSCSWHLRGTFRLCRPCSTGFHHWSWRQLHINTFWKVHFFEHTGNRNETFAFLSVVHPRVCVYEHSEAMKVRMEEELISFSVFSY